MNNRWYKFFKYILIDPWLRIYDRPYYIGSERIPQEGPALMVSNHLAVIDHFFSPLICRRQLTFLAKAECFTTPDFAGGIQKFFSSSVGQVPIGHTSGDAIRDALIAGLKVLSHGNLLGISLEGTCGPDGRLYRGRTGAAHVALKAGMPMFPMTMVDTEKANPIGSWIPHPARVGTIIGDPIDPSEYKARYNDEYEAARVLTDNLIKEVQKLFGQEYVDAYAANVKKPLEAGNGYPAGTESGRELTTPAPGLKPTPRRWLRRAR